MKTKQVIILLTVITILTIVPTIILLIKTNSTKGKILVEASYEESKEEKKVDKINETKTINVLNEEVNVKYLCSKYGEDIYEDADNEEYYLIDGKLVGFNRSKEKNRGN